MFARLIALFVSTLLISQTFALSEQEMSERLVSEFVRLKEYAKTLTPDYTIGEKAMVKDFENGVTLLWMLDAGRTGSDTIRLMKARENGELFVVSFHRNRLIGEGEMVLRRFYGPSKYGWRNDSVHWDSGTYFGTQGTRRPMMNESEVQMLKDWDIQTF